MNLPGSILVETEGFEPSIAGEANMGLRPIADPRLCCASLEAHLSVRSLSATITNYFFELHLSDYLTMPIYAEVYSYV